MNALFDTLHMAFNNVWMYGGTFILVLSILVFVHEWGHYIVARLCGVKVETFSIGFGKELFGRNDKHGTRWKFSLVPLGGYVKMFGDTDPASAGHKETVGEGLLARPMTAEDRKGAFFAKPVWQRALIVFAGPAINFIFAIILLSGLYVAYGQPVTPPTASAIIKDSAADKAGFQPHDRVIAIDGSSVRRFEDIRQRVMIALDTPMKFTVLRDGKEVDLTATPERENFSDRFGFEHSRGILGLIGAANGFSTDTVVAVNGKPVEKDAAVPLLKKNLDRKIEVTFKGIDGADDSVLIVRPLAELNNDLGSDSAKDENGNDAGKLLVISEKVGSDIVKHNVFSAVKQAGIETRDVTVGTLTALGQIVTGTRSPKELGGLIRIGAMAGDMAQAGIVAVITFTALLSINLGLINLFPIPVLDGGHLVFYALEAVKGSPIPEKAQEYAFRLGFTILIGLMVFANLSDILQLIL
ncbi:MAG: RIP metalloprotease RseP [Micavibrio aeruginosavorus]|uniref:Zinc metalloprotease n=1 Tax=Micavibrio aeruginosavorus TaxID=349221 RepID=A0A2W5PR44_9BACT|nr:MAG: RIP metalloprotease RseP [Micavibrio aeruginosavorus]